MAGATRVIEITGGNVRNEHIYLRGHLDFFPQDAVGGSNKDAASLRPVQVEWAPGEVMETDIDSDKQFFRKRSWVREFFDRNHVREGDVVVIEKVAERYFRVMAAKRSEHFEPSRR